MGANLVLVIEDHLLQQMNTAEILREAGYHVIEAMDAAVMPDVAERRAGVPQPGADVQMARVRDGVDLALLIRRMYPHIRVILSSSVFGPPDRAGYVRLTPKPLSQRQIALESNGAWASERLVH
jgi:CheY-like chemotaxis protein